MNTYCLGCGMDACKSCLHDENWKILNQMPDSLRLALQKTTRKVDNSACQLLSGAYYKKLIED